jgi:hypothetical protein
MKLLFALCLAAAGGGLAGCATPEQAVKALDVVIPVATACAAKVTCQPLIDERLAQNAVEALRIQKQNIARLKSCVAAQGLALEACTAK